jgi:hypothetical protein
VELDLEPAVVGMVECGRAHLREHELRLLDLVVLRVREDSAQRRTAHGEEGRIGRQRQADMGIGRHI